MEMCINRVREASFDSVVIQTIFRCNTVFNEIKDWWKKFAKTRRDFLAGRWNPKERKEKLIYLNWGSFQLPTKQQLEEALHDISI